MGAFITFLIFLLPELLYYFVENSWFYVVIEGAILAAEKGK